MNSQTTTDHGKRVVVFEMACKEFKPRKAGRGRMSERWLDIQKTEGRNPKR